MCEARSSRRGGSWSATVGIGSERRYPTRPDRVTIVLASPSVAATLASYEGRPGALRPVPALPWQTLATITVTRKPPPAASSPEPSAAPSPVVGVAGLAVDGHPVTSGQQVTITGPAAARQVTSRFTTAAPAGDRFFALTTPLSSAASYVQGEIVPGRSWSHVRYPTGPDRVTIVLASPSVAATLASYEGRPAPCGRSPPCPGRPWPPSPSPANPRPRRAKGSGHEFTEQQSSHFRRPRIRCSDNTESDHYLDKLSQTEVAPVSYWLAVFFLALLITGAPIEWARKPEPRKPTASHPTPFGPMPPAPANATAPYHGDPLSRAVFPACW